MHLVLEVETAKAVESTLERSVNDLKENLMDKRVRFKLRERTKEGTTIFEFPDAPSRDAFEKILKNDYPDLDVATSEMSEGKGLVSLKINDKRAAEIKKLAVEQSLETIRNRVDQFGISEPEIIPQGSGSDHRPTSRCQGPGPRQKPDRPDRPSGIQTRRRRAQPGGGPQGERSGGGYRRL